MNGKLTCKTCGSTHIIDEVVDFCVDCRSYDIGFKFDNGLWDEPSKEELDIFQKKEEIRKNKEKLIIDEQRVSLSDVSDAFFQLKELVFDYYYAVSKIFPNLKDKKDFLEKNKQLFSVFQLPEIYSKIKYQKYNEYQITSSFKQTLQKIDLIEDIFKKLGYKELINDHIKINIALSKINYNKNKKIYIKEMK